MTARGLLCAAIAACGPGIAHPGERSVASDALVAASGDAAAIERLLQVGVVEGGLWFADTSCVQFSGGGQIAPERFHELARCLATLHWAKSTRNDALPDTAVLTYPPGFEIEARVVNELNGPRLVWIGYEARRDNADALPTVTPQALEALRTAGAHDGPLDPERAKALAPDDHAWFKVCIDGTGAVTSADLRETTTIEASKAFGEAIAKWQFRPFLAVNRPVPVCAMMRLANSPESVPPSETIPFPAPPSRSKKQPIVFAPNAKTVDAKRIAGNKLILPDDGVKRAMAKRHDGSIVGAFRLCLDESGHVESVLPIRSTGYASYDRELMAGIWKWVYSPFLVDGVATPVCTAVTFHYSQS